MIRNILGFAVHTCETVSSCDGNKVLDTATKWKNAKTECEGVGAKIDEKYAKIEKSIPHGQKLPTKVNEKISEFENGPKNLEFEQPKIQSNNKDLEETYHETKYENQVDWWEFDEKVYLEMGALTPGEDPYYANQFNQEVSDKIKSDRKVPDTRHADCRKDCVTKTYFFTSGARLTEHALGRPII